MTPRDIGLFLISSRTDAKIKRLRCYRDAQQTFEAIYRGNHDPWASASTRYRYQRRKYDTLISLLPNRQFERALDVGCGTGVLTRQLAPLVGQVVGLDIAPAALELARIQSVQHANLRFAQCDALALDAARFGQFDLVMVADVFYYLAPLDDAVLKRLARQIVSLLAPGGHCLLAHQYFFRIDAPSRLTRRIHDAFCWAPQLECEAEYRRSFYLASLLKRIAR
ncbi:MAG: class I SAM-dependent DNA methyltransferase [Gammaproteobacteria bacterium]